jgi:hypothetical protein
MGKERYRFQPGCGCEGRQESPGLVMVYATSDRSYIERLKQVILHPGRSARFSNRAWF